MPQGWTKFPLRYWNWPVVLLAAHYQACLRDLLKPSFSQTNGRWLKKVTPIFKKGTKSDLFINLSKKAFDTIDHETILRKLANYRGDEHSLRWLTSHLSNWSQRCNLNGALSNARDISCGVPQGSIIGPLLFLIYINDLPNCLTVKKMFADDTNISIPSRTLADLQPLINFELAINYYLNCWLRANKLSLSVVKTEFMIIGSCQRLLAESNNEICVELENHRIERYQEIPSR